MTRVCVSTDGPVTRITATGHAADERVCAAVSTLLQTALGFLLVSGAEILRRKMEPGDADLEFICAGVRCETVRDYLSVGFAMLDRDYPEQISFQDNRQGA